MNLMSEDVNQQKTIIVDSNNICNTLSPNKMVIMPSKLLIQKERIQGRT